MLTLMFMSHRSSHRCMTQLSVMCDSCQYSNGRVHCIKQVTLLYRLGQVSGEAVQIQCKRRRWGVSGPPIRGVASHHHMLPVPSRTHPVTMLHVPQCSGASLSTRCTSCTLPVHLYQPFTLPVHWLLLQATGCLPHCQPLSQRINCLKETNV